ncbi:hypothetical protein QE152_g8626 [Popillia japonica]|uniref:Reverse transcriptase n=1 Tax=Popillia japonica TaxID=7064 RepID=A0AAW1M5Y4_POPJA
MIILTDSQDAIKGVTKKGYSADAHPLVTLVSPETKRQMIWQWKEREEKSGVAKFTRLTLKVLGAWKSEQEWEKEVQNSEKGLRYKAASCGQKTKPWVSKIKFDGCKFITTICRLRFHHNHLNGHLYRLKMVESPNCDCGVEEDASHVFFGCERREAQTTELHLDLMNLGQQPPFNTYIYAVF